MAARRLLFVVADLRTGGAERHVVTLLPALDSARYDVQVVCLHRGGELLPQAVRAGLAVTVLGLADNELTGPVAVARLRDIMRRERIDVVMSHGFQPSILARLAARAAGVPTRIVWRHNVGHLGRHGWLDRQAERLLGRSTTRYFGVSYGQIGYLTETQRLDPRKIRVIHNGLDPAEFEPTESDVPAAEPERDKPSPGLTVAVIAQLRREKDHPLVFEAVRRVIDAGRSCELLVIGDGPLRAPLVEEARRLGLADIVHFLGNRDDAPRLIATADVVVLGSFAVENLPYAVLEAMAMARPSVCTAIGGLPELIEDDETGYLVPPRAPQALADALLRVADRPDRGRQMGRAARRRLEQRFTVASAADRTMCETDAAIAVAMSAPRRAGWSS